MHHQSLCSSTLNFHKF